MIEFRGEATPLECVYKAACAEVQWRPHLERGETAHSPRECEEYTGSGSNAQLKCLESESSNIRSTSL